MKKILFTLVALAASMSMNAQTMKVMKGDRVVAIYTEEEADHVEFLEPITGKAKATINSQEVDVKWIQLWENGPKFAEYNVGVTNGDAGGYGSYYTWGGSENKSETDYNTGSSALSGNTDTATKLWGENWRMPSKEEFDDLIANCTVDWTGTCCKFTGKGVYSHNSILLPLAGFYALDGDNGEAENVEVEGNYWSSTPNPNLDSSGETSAYCLYVDEGDGSVNVSEFARRHGFSVRAVLNEK